jgi:ABC-2 type transport system ATP-binding protein
MDSRSGAPQGREWVFSAESVTKTYNAGDVLANDRITISVAPGEVYGLLGPNGAGKTTFVKQVIGLLKPTSGSIRLGPYDLVEDPDVARQLCSYLPQAQMPIESFKAREAIDITGQIRGGPSGEVHRRRDELIEALQIGEWRDTLGAKLSGGVRRLVGFAMVSVWPGRIVILDEPTNDVDPLRRRLMWEQIRRLGAEGVAVFLVTHNVQLPSASAPLDGGDATMLRIGECLLLGASSAQATKRRRGDLVMWRIAPCPEPSPLR